MLGLITLETNAQDIRLRNLPYLRCIPFYIDRPFQPIDSSNTTTETLITIGSPTEPYYFVRVDTRSSNLWVTADKVIYQQSSITIVDQTITTVGAPEDPSYTVRTDLVMSYRNQERLSFPNRTYIIAESSSFGTNSVLTENSFKATRYCYGSKFGIPLTKSQYERLKKWLGM